LFGDFFDKLFFSDRCDKNGVVIILLNSNSNIIIIVDDDIGAVGLYLKQLTSCSLSIEIHRGVILSPAAAAAATVTAVMER